MRSLFRKPFVYTAVFSAALTLCFLYTLLLVFVIPRDMEGTDHLQDADPFTGSVDIDWGNNSANPSDGHESSEELFTTSPEETYPIVTDSLYMDESIRIEISQIRRFDTACRRKRS